MNRIFFFLFQFIVVTGFAQTRTKISGIVIDTASVGVSSATIRLLNSNYSTVADKFGTFTISNIPAGSYTIEVAAIGYAINTQKVVAGRDTLSFATILRRAPNVLDEVVITAQKREEVLQEVPVSITTLSAKQVDEYRLWNINQITGIVPNMYSADPGDRRNVSSLRGISTTSYDPAVATYIDGVNQFNLDTYIAQLFDVERIEVLRGPQGTLYGRNAMAGVINVITKQPTNKVGGFAEATIGNLGLQRYSAGIRTPLVKNKLFLGVAGLYEHSNGYYTNAFNNSKFDKQNSLTGNYYLKYLANERWSLTLNAKHNNNRNNGAFSLVTGVEEAFKKPYEVNQNATTRLIDNIFNTSLSINYGGRGFNFSSQTSYQSNYRYYTSPIDADFSPIDGITLINNYGKDWNKVQVLTQELRFTSPASSTGKLRWTAGTYLFSQNNPVKQTTHFGNDAALVGAPDVNFGLINSTITKSKGVAIFGQGTYAVSDKLELTAGVRYDYENKDQSILGEYQKDPNPTPVFAYRTDTAASASFKAFSPKAALSYKLSSRNLFFASYSRGFRAGGLTPLSSDPSQPALFSYSPEYSNNYEIGLKNTLLSKKLLLNITAFYSTVNDAQVPTLVLPDAVTITRNTGRLNSKGIELESIALFNRLRVDYNFGYTDATFQNLKVAQNGGEVDLKGKKQIFTPVVTSMFAAQYSLPISNKNKLKALIRGEWKFLGKQYFNLANTISQSDYSLFNARLEVSTDKYALILWGRNLSNYKYISYAYDFGAVHLGEPGTFGVTGRVSF